MKLISTPEVKFPEDFEVEAILSLGMPEQHPQSPDITEELLPKLHHNKY